jgi:hypothetical protein
MDSFTNNPTEWSVIGNLIGVILGNLTDLEGWTGNHSTVVAGTTREMAGQSINFIRVNYQA